jgi:uncharacterized membrane protein YfhO
VTAIEDHSNELVITLTAERPAWLVIADTYYPGWHAEVNGAPITIQRANLAFRAVQVEAGASTVRMRYEPGWLQPGAFISGLSLLVLLLLFRLRVPSEVR